MIRSHRGLLLLACLALPVWAQPPRVVQSSPGLDYEVKACAGLGADLWLGGTVAQGDGFLTRLGPDGRSMWQRRFGGEGQESVEALAPLADGTVIVVGRSATDLKLAWAGQPQTDWERQSYVARISGQGELMACLDVRAGAGDLPEGSLHLQAVAAGDGQIWVAGRFMGTLWNLKARDSTAFVAQLNSDLQVVRAQVLDGEEVTHLQTESGGCLAVGMRKKGDREQLILWKIDAAGAREAWAGQPSANASCSQLEADHLVLAEDRDRWQLNLSDLKRSRLPADVLATATWQGSDWALGSSQGKLAGTTSIGEGDVVLWHRKASEWKPECRLGTRRLDYLPFLVASPGQLTLAGRSRGAFPGQTPGPAEESRATWIRFFHPPQSEELPGLGVRAAEATRSQLAQSFADLCFEPRPGYDHFSGWLDGPDRAVVSREGYPYDRWVCQHRDGQELSSWGPPKNLPAPLEPQIFPLLSRSQVVCLAPRQGARWFRLDAQGKIQAQQTLRRSTGLRVEQLAAGDENCLWVGREFTRKGQQRALIGVLDREGRETWSSPLGGWTGQGFACLALARDGQRCALLWDGEERCELQCLQLPSKQLFRVSQPGRPQTLTWVDHQLWLASQSKGRLLLEAYTQAGKRVWQKALADSADFHIAQILPTPTGAMLVGSRQDAVAARGLLVEVDAHGVEQSRWSPAFDRDLLFQAARFDASGQLWLAGETVEDYETDVFWGRLRK